MQCKALKKDGGQCKLKAIEDSEYCRMHQEYQEGEVAPSVQTPYKKFEIKYTGAGTYTFKNRTFYPGKVYTVSREDADYLLAREDRFEAA